MKNKITPFFLIVIIVTTFMISASSCWAQSTQLTRKMAAEYRDKGYDAQRSRDFDTALSFYQKALELDPSLTIIYNDMGVIYESKGWMDQAKKAYGKAIEADPSLASPYYNLASIYEKEGDLDRAIYYFKKRVLVGDFNDEWTIRARQELKSLGVDDPSLDEKFMDRDLDSFNLEDGDNRPRGNDLSPRDRKYRARQHFLRGKQLSSQGRHSEALMELGLAEALDPKNREIQKTLEDISRDTFSTN